MLLGRAKLPKDTYQLIVKNNYPVGKGNVEGGVFSKAILVSEVDSLGTKDPMLGFFMFVCGMLMYLLCRYFYTLLSCLYLL